MDEELNNKIWNVIFTTKYSICLNKMTQPPMGTFNTVDILLYRWEIRVEKLTDDEFNVHTILYFYNMLPEWSVIQSKGKSVPQSGTFSHKPHT